MTDDETIGLLILGGLFMMSHKEASALPWGEGWVWPIPDITYGGINYPAVVSQEFHPPAHAGVDLMYRRRSLNDVPQVPAGSGGTTQFFAPDGVHVVAARDARVWSVDKGARGIQIVLDHGKPWATFYTHLSSTTLGAHSSGFPGGDKTKPVTTVRAGDIMGVVGIDPLDEGRVRHLHFAVWYKGAGDSASVDPVGNMGRWARRVQTL